MNAAITASSYSVTFASAAFSPDAVAVTGAFSATFTGGAWSSVNGATAGQGTLIVTGATGSTDRTGCATASKNTTGATGVYDAAVNGASGSGAPFTVQNGTLTISGGAGTLPYSDTVDWTFVEM